MAYGTVDRRIWHDERFRSWDRDTRDTWLYLLTTNHANRLGCFVLPALYVADDVQISVEAAKRSLRRLEEDGRIIWDQELRVVMICNHLEYNPLANPNVVKAALKDLAELPNSRRCLLALYEAVRLWGDPTTAKGDEPFYSLLTDALKERLEEIGETVTETLQGTVPETVTETTLEGSGNPEPEPEPLPEPEPEPVVGEAESPGSRESGREEADSAPPPPEERSNLENVVEYLGEEHRAIVRAVAGTARKPDTWALGFWGQYGPNGTEERLMATVDEDERPEVLAVSLQRLTTEGEKYSGNFFRGIVRSVIRERTSPQGPDHGDESARDAQRRHEARRRASERNLDRVDQESEKAEAEMAELWSWWEGADDETRTRIEAKAERRAKEVPKHMHRPILIGVIQEHRAEQAEGAAA